MNKSESIAELSKALANFHTEVKQPMKDANNPFFKSKYVPLENVVEAITETASKHGLSFVQWASNDANGRVGVATMLMHSSGEYIEFDPVFMNADKNTAQGAGALISYLKRYSLSAVFGITSDQDDDANQASGNTKQQKQQSVQPKKPTNEQIKKPTNEQIKQLKTEIEMFIDTALGNGVTDKYQTQLAKLQNMNVYELNAEQAARTSQLITKWMKEIE